jgi:hypothetical protein
MLLQVVYVRALLKVQTLFIYGSWSSENGVFVHVFHVQLLWELNPNRAKSLEFGGCRKNNKILQKTQEEGP